MSKHVTTTIARAKLISGRVRCPFRNCTLDQYQHHCDVFVLLKAFNDHSSSDCRLALVLPQSNEASLSRRYRTLTLLGMTATVSTEFAIQPPLRSPQLALAVCKLRLIVWPQKEDGCETWP